MGDPVAKGPTPSPAPPPAAVDDPAPGFVANGTPLPGTQLISDVAAMTARPSPPFGYHPAPPIVATAVPVPEHVDAGMEPTAIVAPLPLPDVERSFREGAEVRMPVRMPSRQIRRASSPRRRWLIGGVAIALSAIGAVVIIARPWADEVTPAPEPVRAIAPRPEPAPTPAPTPPADKAAITAPAPPDEIKQPDDDRPAKKRAHRPRAAAKAPAAKAAPPKKPVAKPSRDRKPPRRPPPATDAQGNDLPF